jgi:polar amino acid transport system substrate-binding protein
VSVRPLGAARIAVSLVALAAVLFTPACAPAVSPASSAGSTSASPVNLLGGDCGPTKLATYQPGKLTWAMELAGIRPFYYDNIPSDGQGFEAALAMKIGNLMGFAGKQVWIDQPWEQAVGPGPKHFDGDINETTITIARAEQVSFTRGYADDTQAVVVDGESPLATSNVIHSVADLRGLRLAVQDKTTSNDMVTQVVKPTQPARVLDTHDKVVAALRNHLVDAIVVDSATAWDIANNQGVQNAKVVGQIEWPKDLATQKFSRDPANAKEQFGIVVDRDKPKITQCFDAALEHLEKDGELDMLKEQWLEPITFRVPLLAP